MSFAEAGLNVTAPTVKILQPSKKECTNQKADKKTLVCVASGFYPDHVSVSWEINGVPVTDGVATDNAALRDDITKYYNISSRLRVSAKDWFTPDKTFLCIVSFYNGKENIYPNASITGVPDKGGVLSREKYLRVSQTAKLSYSVFIVKSCIYGAFVAFLVWKLQGSTGKQNH